MSNISTSFLHNARLTCLLLLLLVFSNGLNAQTSEDSVSTNQKIDLDGIRTAEDLVSGSYHDVLNSFFQFAFKDLTGADKQMQFTSSLFAIRLKANPTLNIDTNFIHQKFARNFNFSYALKLDSSFRFNGFSLGAKYAIINCRDASSRKFAIDVRRAIKLHSTAFNNIVTAISGLPDPAQQITFITQLNDYRDRKKAFIDLDPALQKIISSETSKTFGTQNPDFLIEADKLYTNIKDKYANKFLLVGGFNTATFKDQFLVKDVNIYLEGIGDLLRRKSRHGLELNSMANLRWADDSTSMVRDLSRCTFHVNAGLNFVYRNQKDISLLEFKAGCTYNKLMAGKLSGEDDDVFTLDGTLRIRITKDVSIPLEFKYDPETSNVLGLLNVTTNFDLLDRLLRKS